MYKVKSVLRGNAKDRVAALETQVWINSPQDLFNANAPNALDVLFDSMAEKKQVALQYQSLYSNELVDRIIEPVGLFNENNYWYVMAFCHLRTDYRQFRLDRIMQIKRTDKPFTREHGSTENYRKTDDCREKTKVVISIAKEYAKYIQFGRKYYGFVSEKVMGDKIEMTFMTADVQEGLPRWYLMFGDCAEIIEPESLKKRVTELLEKTKKNLTSQN
jgi:predicted DNA-binding transcriptional regulator YafY